MKVMLIGRLDREDGGYMCPIGVVIPCEETKSYKKAINWLKGVPELVKNIIDSQCQDEYNDELEEEVVLTFDDLTEMSYEGFGLHLDFEKNNWIYDIQLSVQFLEVYQKTISEEDNG